MAVAFLAYIVIVVVFISLQFAKLSGVVTRHLNYVRWWVLGGLRH